MCFYVLCHEYTSLLVLLHSHGIGGDKEVSVVKQCYLWPLHQQQESELDKQHEGELPNAADLQEHGAGQQRQQHAVAEILWRTGDELRQQQQITGKARGNRRFFMIHSLQGRGRKGLGSDRSLNPPQRTHSSYGSGRASPAPQRCSASPQRTPPNSWCHRQTLGGANI